MRFSTYINNQKAIEWGLNANQAALFDLLNQATSWAEEIIVDGVVYYWVSRNKVLEELPLFYKTSDTVYRHFAELDEKKLIVYLKQGKHGDKDLIRLTEKGKSWNEFKPEQIRDNSEINPSLGDELGNKSEITRKQIRDNSEINPTNNNTNYKNTTDHNNKKNKQKKTELFESHFEKFWNAGMRKVNKKKALSSFIANYELYNAKYPTELEDFTQILVDDVKKRIRLGEFGFDKLHPMTYLNNWRWEDESPAENKTQEQKPSVHSNFGNRNYGKQVIPEWALEGEK